jgi:hypothetical protein
MIGWCRRGWEVWNGVASIGSPFHDELVDTVLDELSRPRWARLNAKELLRLITTTPR